MQKKRIQKALVMLLAVVMILGMQPATVHAVDLAEEPTNEQQASTTAEPEDKETALPENEPDAEATTEESTAEPEDKEHGGTGGQRDRSAGERTRCRSIGGSPR